ncbi:putative leucine-rich repeat receptor-like protein kinase IMK3 [Platanthera zijinensis]|uniref:Leucine-rich repeat receptor-like protein kinase IMK3 n=1 Tax=Platanthera zijinensis TaxID=2320716 RepID=A0AAP0B0V6_9ASPA
MSSKICSERFGRKKERQENSLLLRRSHLPLFIRIAAFLLFIPFSIPSWDGIIITQEDYDGLLAFKHAINDPQSFLRSWNSTGLSACSGQWVGIKCVRGKVIAIQLPWRELSGRITEKIGQLTALRKLSLHDNAIGGQIPSAIGFLRDLRGIYIFNNRFSGEIPPSIGNCIALQTLDLSHNLLAGSIPSSLSNSSRLYRLNLSLNNFTGSIPDSLSILPSLTYLLLQHNNLSGSIPKSFGRLLFLEDMILSNNKFNGSIPEEFGLLSRLTTLDLSSNFFSGSLPVSLSKLSSLTLLNLENNKIGGKLQVSIGRLKNLSSLSLKRNNFDGEIPETLGDISSLSQLDLSENRLAGKIPPSFDRLTNLTFFNVSFNNLSGQVPPLLSKRFNSASFLGNNQLCGYSDLATSGSDVGGKLVHFDGPLAFTADDLLCATAEIMGKSTYGTMYKATLEDGSQVAVKRLRERIARNQKEFEAEVNILGKIRHTNLLALRAYYVGPKGEKLLVFYYMPKGSLAAFLHARGPETTIDWLTRMRIAMGAAHGLRHLHVTSGIIHGNLTSFNILLDEDTTPKIADFGLSRLMTASANSNVIAAAGALGYRAPELSKLKKASTKTDMYSLGVIILELLTGKSPGEPTNGMELPQWVASIVKEEWTNEVFDVEIMRDAAAGDEPLNMLKLALHCVDPTPAARPEVHEVLKQMEEILPELAAAGRETEEGSAVPGASGEK